MNVISVHGTAFLLSKEKSAGTNTYRNQDLCGSCRIDSFHFYYYLMRLP